jgi:WD40 repeat protein/DNA-directed RNA polymerase subunit RPC12/RpoP
MPTLVKCTGCQRQLQVPEDSTGKKVKCPLCGFIFLAQITPEITAAKPLAMAPLPPIAKDSISSTPESTPESKTSMPPSRADSISQAGSGSVSPIRSQGGSTSGLRNRIFGAIGVVLGGGPVLDTYFNGFPQGRGAYYAGQIAGMVLGWLLFVVGFYYLVRGAGHSKTKSSSLKKSQTSSISHFPPIEIKVKICKDPAAVLKGQFQATLQPDGLTIHQGRKLTHFVPRGSLAKHLGGNRLLVSLDDRQIELALVKFGCYEKRLAADVTAFLNGQKPTLSVNDYNRSWYLGAVCTLPLAMILGGILPVGPGFGLACACFAIAQIQNISIATRMGAACGLTIFSCLILMVTTFVLDRIKWVQPSPFAWQVFNSGEGRFSVLVPKEPIKSTAQLPSPPFERFTSIHQFEAGFKQKEVDFLVHYYDIPTFPAKVPVNIRQQTIDSFPNGQLESEQEVQVHEYKGTEFIFNVQGAKVVRRVFPVNNRVFFLTVSSSQWDGIAADAEKFFESFSLDMSNKLLPENPSKSFQGIFQVQEGSMGVNGMAFSPDGKMLATTTMGAIHEIRLWNVASRKLVHKFSGRDPLEFSADGEYLVFMKSSNRDVQVYETVNNKLLPHNFPVHPPKEFTQGTQPFALFPGSQTVVVRYETGLRFYDFATGKLEKTWEWPKMGERVNNVAVSPDGKWVAQQHQTYVQLREMPDGNIVRSNFVNLAGRTSIPNTSFSSDGKVLGIFSPNYPPIIVNIPTGTQEVLDHVVPKKFNQLFNSTLVFAPSGRHLAIAIGGHMPPAKYHNKIYFLDGSSYKMLAELDPLGDVTCLTFSPDGQTLAAGSYDHRGSAFVEFYDVPTVLKLTPEEVPLLAVRPK